MSERSIPTRLRAYVHWKCHCFPTAAIDQLIACQNYHQCLQFLEEKGWGGTDTSGDAEAILTREEEKIWEVVKDLSIDMAELCTYFPIQNFSII